MKNFFRKIKTEYYYYLFFAFLFAVSLFWFRGINSNEFFYIRGTLLSLNSNLPDTLFVWDSKWLGVDGASYLPSTFWSMFYVLIFNLGGSIKQAQTLFYPIIFVAPAITMFFSLKSVGQIIERKGKPSKNLLTSSLLGSALYVLNPFMILFWHAGHYERNFFVFAFFPLFITSLIRLGVEDKDGFKKGLVWGILFFFIGNNLTPLVISFFGFGFLTFILIALVFNKVFSFKSYFRFITVFVPIAVLVNLWWLGPYFIDLIYHTNKFGNVAHGVDYVGLTAEFSGFLQKLMLIAKWTWSASWNDRFFHSFYPIYRDYHLYIFWFPVLLFSLSIFLFKVKEKLFKSVIFFGGLFLIFSLFMSKGIKPPVGSIFTFMYEKIPLFYMFRNPGHKFGGPIIFSLSILLWASSYYALEKGKSRIFKKALPVLVMICIFIYSWPLFTGVAIREKSEGGMPDNIVSIPEEYTSIANFINRDTKPGRTLFLSNYASAFLPNGDLRLGYDGTDILEKIIDSPTIHILPPESRGYILSIESLKKLFSAKHDYMLPILGIKYIVGRGDYIGDCDVCNSLQKTDYTKEILNLDYLTLLQIREKFLRPLIYLSNEVYPLEGLGQEINENQSDVTYLSKDEIDDISIKLGVVLPEITYRKINPTLYHVYIKNAKDSFLMNYLTSFNEGWEVRLLKSNKLNKSFDKFTLFSNLFINTYSGKLDEKSHILINGFGNGWLINPTELCSRYSCNRNSDGTYSFDLYVSYRYQGLFLIYMLISLLALFSGLVVHFYIRMQENKNA